MILQRQSTFTMYKFDCFTIKKVYPLKRNLVSYSVKPFAIRFVSIFLRSFGRCHELNILYLISHTFFGF